MGGGNKVCYPGGLNDMGHWFPISSGFCFCAGRPVYYFSSLRLEHCASINKDKVFGLVACRVNWMFCFFLLQAENSFGNTRSHVSSVVTAVLHTIWSKMLLSVVLVVVCGFNCKQGNLQLNLKQFKLHCYLWKGIHKCY